MKRLFSCSFYAIFQLQFTIWQYINSVNTIYSWIEGKEKMSQKSVTLVTILTNFFHVILERNILKPWNLAWYKKNNYIS